MINSGNFSRSGDALGSDMPQSSDMPTDGQRVLEHAHDQNTLEAWHAGALYLQKRLAEMTDRRLTTRIIPNAQMGSESEMVEKVIAGDLDAVTLTAANGATVVPELSLFSLPWLFIDGEHFRRVVTDPVFTQLLDAKLIKHQPGVRRLATFTPGVRNLYTKKGPLTTLDDLRGLRMRVMASPVEALVWETLGASPVPMPFQRILKALENDEIDAADDTIAVYAAQRHFEVAPFHVLTHHQWSLGLLLINTVRLEELPKDECKALFAIGREMTDYVVSFAIASARTAGRSLSGTTSFCNIDVEPLQRCVKPLYDVVARDLAAEDMLERIRQLA